MLTGYFKGHCLFAVKVTWLIFSERYFLYTLTFYEIQLVTLNLHHAILSFSNTKEKDFKKHF